MYMDDATMYMDILPFDTSNPKMESNKLLLPEPTDPWLVSQAGISDIRFPTVNTTSNSSLFGRLSPDLEQLANSLLPSEMSMPQVDDTFDIDVALSSFSLEKEYNLDTALESLELDPPNEHPEVTTERRRSKRLSSKSTCTTSYLEPHISAVSYPNPAQNLSIVVDQSSAWSPVSDADGDVDSNEGFRIQRKRRPKISYSTLTEDQKYQHIRSLNNVASRQYRDRMRGQLASLQEQEIQERQRNQVLRTKAEGLEQLRDEIKTFTYNFFRDHVRNSEAK